MDLNDGRFKLTAVPPDGLARQHPEYDNVLRVEIDGNDDEGYFIIEYRESGAIYDAWAVSLEDAFEQAHAGFLIKREAWEVVPK